MPHVNARRNKAGIPVIELRTVRIPAAVWAGNFEFAPTTTVIKLVKK